MSYAHPWDAVFGLDLTFAKQDWILCASSYRIHQVQQHLHFTGWSRRLAQLARQITPLARRQSLQPFCCQAVGVSLRSDAWCPAPQHTCFMEVACNRMENPGLVDNPLRLPAALLADFIHTKSVTPARCETHPDRPCAGFYVPPCHEHEHRPSKIAVSRIFQHGLSRHPACPRRTDERPPQGSPAASAWPWPDHGWSADSSRFRQKA